MTFIGKIYLYTEEYLVIPFSYFIFNLSKVLDLGAFFRILVGKDRLFPNEMFEIRSGGLEQFIF